METNWIRETDRSGEYTYLHTPFCRYEVRPSGKTKFKALVHGVWTICEQDFAGRVRDLARANSYIRIADDERVVKVSQLRAAIVELIWPAGPANTATPGFWSSKLSSTVRDFTAAIDAAGGGK